MCESVDNDECQEYTRLIYLHIRLDHSASILQSNEIHEEYSRKVVERIASHNEHIHSSVLSLSLCVSLGFAFIFIQYSKLVRQWDFCSLNYFYNHEKDLCSRHLHLFESLRFDSFRSEFDLFAYCSYLLSPFKLLSLHHLRVLISFLCQ